MFRYIFLISLWILISLSTFSQNNYRYIKKAKKLASKKKYTEAINLFDEAITINPNNINAYVYKSLLHEELKEYSKAISCISKSFELGYKPTSLYIRRGYCYFQNKQDSNAITDFNHALSEQANSFEALFHRGLIYKYEGNYTDALKDFNQIINQASFYDISKNRLQLTYYEKASCYYKNKQYNKALLEFDNLYKKDSANYKALGYRAKVKFKLKNYKGALNDCNIYLENCNENTNYILHRKGLALKKLKRYNEALSTFDALINEHPNDCEPYNSRADLNLKIGDYNSALIDVNSSLEIKDNYIPALLTKAEILFQLKDFHNMCINYNKAIELGFTSYSNRLNEIQLKCKQ